jgi:vacuolar iron transporter family protein
MIPEAIDRLRKVLRRRHEDAVLNDYNSNPTRGRDIRSTVRGRYLRSVTYGGLDGIITTFAVVAGVAGASLTTDIILILGFSNLFADGLSMAVGDFLSSRAEGEYEHTGRIRQRLDAARNTDAQRQESAKSFIERGIPEEDAQKIATTLAKYPDAMADTISDGIGSSSDEGRPVVNAAYTFGSFCVFGFAPILPFVLVRFVPTVQPDVFLLSAALSALTLFGLGAIRAMITLRSWFLAGAEMLAVGGIAAIVAWLVGHLLAGVA